MSRRTWILPVVVLLLGACRGKGDDVGVSHKIRVQQKSGEVWGRDLATGLGLETWDLCTELGSSDCITDAHRITLGGVEPERLGIDEPIENALVSAPIAVDRVAISACSERYERDQGGSPVVFGPVLDKDNKKHRTEVAEGLVRRLLGRHPTKDDTKHLLALYDELEPISTDVVRDWSVGACVVVATSTEALFY